MLKILYANIPMNFLKTDCMYTHRYLYGKHSSLSSEFAGEIWGKLEKMGEISRGSGFLL